MVPGLKFLSCCTACLFGPFVPGVCLALDLAVQTVKPGAFWERGYTGDGIEIGVLDLFLADATHPAINGNYRGSVNFANGAGWISDHPTSVVGAAASQDPLRRGVAFGAGWWTGQTTNRGTITKQRTQTVAAETFAGGLGALAGNAVEVLEMSIGLGGSDSANDQWSLALDHIAATQGTTIVVAAGNAGPTSSSFSGPPASAYNVLSVGATGGTGNAVSENYGQIAPYSTRGRTDGGRSKPDLVAPGSLIQLPTAGGTWSEASGTSFAAPLVAGGAGLLIDMGKDRGMNVDALVVKSVLMNSAEKLAGWNHTPTAPLDPDFGAGQMDLQAAFTQYAAGEQAPGPIEGIGWDFDALAVGTNATYTFDGHLPSDTTLTATLVWNRSVSTDVDDIETAIYTASPMENFDLYLYNLSAPNEPVARSVSFVDNAEHLFLQVPQSGKYALEVRSAGTALDVVPFSLAWHVDSLEKILAGDYNDDGFVDAKDFTAWRDNLGAPAGTLPNDIHGGPIGAGQYASWKAHFGATIGSPAAIVDHQPVPEPSGVVLLALGATTLLLFRSPTAQDAFFANRPDGRTSF